MGKIVERYEPVCEHSPLRLFPRTGLRFYHEGQVYQYFNLPPTAPRSSWSSNRGGWEGEEHRLDLGMKFQDAVTGFNPAFANVRFDLFDVKRGERMNEGKTTFNVCRIYA
jgi:hypothetical protein